MTGVRQIRSRADLQGRRALVLGLARSGVATARYLADASAVVTAYDRRPPTDLSDAVASLEGRSIRLALGVTEAEAQTLVADAELLVTSPSISPRFPTTDPWLREALAEAEARGVELISEVELFLRLTRARVLAVTGTKGKTTTTALLGAIFEAAGGPHAVGGNIGQPLIERVDELDDETWAILELSELQLPTISRGAEIAVYTNIGADHLDRHGSLTAYRAVKARLAELTAAGGGAIVLNAEDPGSRELGARLPGDLRWYGVHQGGQPLEARQEGDALILSGEPLLPVSEVPLPGERMRLDVLAAALGAHLAGVPRAAIAEGIRTFGGVPHRLETIGWRDGVRWVNDSQATIPVAAIAGLEAFAPAPVVVIAGGRGKGLDLAEVADAIATRCRAAVLIGESAAELEALLARRIPVRRAASMDEAVEIAAGLALPGDVVLLSPAAASFDMFTDYAARGDAFRRAMAALPAAANRP
ncbi:MAG: UDP-N-acetylmuramoyl-L-alanine--D-glutamate ligase [Chloroflexota bacterium]|nr:UDP-N-acetylmuramoyl-L-alanine--D-glutamate ligase [Chloroflexota bacterium]